LGRDIESQLSGPFLAGLQWSSVSGYLELDWPVFF
jgi:hypothetical protein